MPEGAEIREERRRLRPYRLLVRGVFWAALLALVAFILRGIVRHLDRMPSVEQYDRLAAVDERALRACADDLLRLNADVHKTRSLHALDPPAYADAEEAWEELEKQRLAVVARCHLDDPGTDAAVILLGRAADSIDKLIRLAAVHEARFVNEVEPYAEEAKAEIDEAGEIIKSRKN